MTAPAEQGAAARRKRTPGERLDRALSRLRTVPPLVRDAVFAAAVAAVTSGMYAVLAELAPAEPSLQVTSAEVWTMGALATAQALLLCFRRVRPGLCMAAIVVLQAGIIAIAPQIMAQGIGPAVAAYTIGSLTTARFTAGAAAAAVVLETGASAGATWGEPGAAVTVLNQFGSSALLYAAAAFVGVYIAARRRNRDLARERSEQVLRAARERAESAILAERSRIARELHDVAAHHLSGMVIQAAAVERLIDRDPAAAREGAAWIRSQGKETLANLRQVVGLLRDRGGSGDGNAPVPGLSALDALVEESRRLGDDVTFVREGEPLALPPIADISLYRIAQQALTNARQHAPGAAVRLRLTYEPHHVDLEAANGRPQREPAVVEHGGTGLVGMRERADLVGAEFDAGPTGDGGWNVHLRLPVREADRERAAFAGHARPDGGDAAETARSGDPVAAEPGARRRSGGGELPAASAAVGERSGASAADGRRTDRAAPGSEPSGDGSTSETGER
ncbi:sensor histidine kinase [Glycomyces albidus]|uniref:histidine kinase n=1 Tax=Glycomyces albidus TaxID=2656774 RepID=A0A6L5GDW9_9ACTN|nr:histidine kinase [Glycomyces albidus]MQM27845.1 two-component sensor histidine kinase [Glycomyces albidus]